MMRLCLICLVASAVATKPSLVRRDVGDVEVTVKSSGIIETVISDAPVEERTDDVPKEKIEVSEVQLFDLERFASGAAGRIFQLVAKVSRQRSALAAEMKQLEEDASKQMVELAWPQLPGDLVNRVDPWTAVPAKLVNGSCCVTASSKCMVNQANTTSNSSLMHSYVMQLPAGPWRNYARAGIACAPLGQTACVADNNCYWSAAAKQCHPSPDLTTCPTYLANAMTMIKHCEAASPPCNAVNSSMGSCTSSLFEAKVGVNCVATCQPAPPASMTSLFGCSGTDAATTACMTKLTSGKFSTQSIGPDWVAFQSCMAPVCPSLGKLIITMGQAQISCLGLTTSPTCTANANCSWMSNSDSGSESCDLKLLNFIPQTCGLYPMASIAMTNPCDDIDSQAACTANSQCTWAYQQVCTAVSTPPSSDGFCKRITPDPNMLAVEQLSAAAKACAAQQATKASCGLTCPPQPSLASTFRTSVSLLFAVLVSLFIF